MNIAMLLDNSFTHDRRVQREASALAEAGHAVTVYALVAAGLPTEERLMGVTVRRVIQSAIFDVKTSASAKSLVNSLAHESWDVLHCHDHTMLDLGVKLKRSRPNTRLVYDSHELFHRWPTNIAGAGLRPILRLKSWLVRKYQVWREKQNARSIDYLITVNRSLADILAQYFRLRCKPTVVRNVPEPVVAVEPEDLLRAKFQIERTDLLLVFIGANIYLKSLNIDRVVDEISNVAGVSFVIISNDNVHREDVARYVRSKGSRNIHFHDAVPASDVHRYLSCCDVGLVSTWNRKELSYWLALDNKLFEYVMAELPILATQQPEYRNIVESRAIGVCVNPDYPGAYIGGLRAIEDKYSIYKLNVVSAKKEFNWDNEKLILLDLYRRIERSFASVVTVS